MQSLAHFKLGWTANGSQICWLNEKSRACVSRRLGSADAHTNHYGMQRKNGTQNNKWFQQRCDMCALAGDSVLRASLVDVIKSATLSVCSHGLPWCGCAHAHSWKVAYAWVIRTLNIEAFHYNFPLSLLMTNDIINMCIWMLLPRKM